MTRVLLAWIVAPFAALALLALLRPVRRLARAVGRGVVWAVRWGLTPIRVADDDQAMGDAPPLPSPVPVEAPTAGGRWCHPTDHVWFADRFAAIAATMPDLAHIDIKRLQAFYIAPEVHQ